MSWPQQASNSPSTLQLQLYLHLGNKPTLWQLYTVVYDYFFRSFCSILAGSTNAVHLPVHVLSCLLHPNTICVTLQCYQYSILSSMKLCFFIVFLSYLLQPTQELAPTARHAPHHLLPQILWCHHPTHPYTISPMCKRQKSMPQPGNTVYNVQVFMRDVCCSCIYCWLK